MTKFGTLLVTVSALTVANGAASAAISLNLPQALADTKAKLGSGEQADILVIGDSLSFSSETTTYLTYFRTLMQAYYGNAGYGYQATSKWTTGIFFHDWNGPQISTDPAPHRSLDGLWVYNQPQIGTPNQAYVFTKNATAELHYVVEPGGGAFEIRRSLDGDVVATINTNSPTNDVMSFTHQLIGTEGAFTVQPLGDASITILGHNNVTSTPGVRVHRAANGGYGVDNFLQRDWTFDKQVGLLHPDLVMVWLGQNDYEYTRDRYRDDLRLLISRVHATVPEAEIVLVGSYNSNAPWLPNLVAAMEDVASQDGVGFINIFQAAGAYSFYQQSNYLSDGIHFSPAGASYLGNMMFNAFVSNGATLEQLVNTTWGVNGDADWSAGSSWVGGAAPGGIDHTATFGTIITSSRVVSVDAPQTVGTMNFNSLSAYTIGGNTITMNVTSARTGLNVLKGSHTITAPIAVNDEMIIATAAESGIALHGGVWAAGRNLIKVGAGTVQFEHVQAARLSIDAGGASIRPKANPNDPSGTSVVQTITIGSGATLDLANNSLVIDYSGAPGTLLNVVRQHLQLGRIISSVQTPEMGLGYGDNALLGKTEFAGKAVDASSALVMFTYFGDTDLDGDVDVADLGKLASNWQTTGVWTGGDFDYSGFVDVADLGILAANWQAGVGATQPASGPQAFSEALASVGLGSAMVPEPFSIGLIGMLGPWSLKRPGHGSRRRNP